MVLNTLDQIMLRAATEFHSPARVDKEGVGWRETTHSMDTSVTFIAMHASPTNEQTTCATLGRGPA